MIKKAINKILISTTMLVLALSSSSFTSSGAKNSKKTETLVTEKKVILQSSATVTPSQTIELVTNTKNAISYETTGSFAWPTPGHDYITYGVGMRWGAYHKGIDISDSWIGGADIVASDGGVVTYVSNTCSHDYGKSYSCGCGGGYGNYVIVDHGNGYQTLYGHMRIGSIRVNVGDRVAKGYTVLGSVGSTGHSTGDHLHFEIIKNGVSVDPQYYL